MNEELADVIEQAQVEMFENTPQELAIKIVFKVKHSPGNEQHLEQIVENYLRPKGVTMVDKIIYV